LDRCSRAAVGRAIGHSPAIESRSLAEQVARLTGNAEIERFLQSKHPELLDEFRAIITAASLDQSAPSP
jgi:hypothetical protein